MEFKLRFSGGTIVELTVEDFSATIVSDISDWTGRVDEQLIQNLDDVLYELKQHNEELNE